MTEYQIIKHCAPTLAGLKSGNLIRISFNNKKDLFGQIGAINRKINNKGIYLIALSVSSSEAWIYIFRPHLLQKLLDNNDAMQILGNLGYDLSSVSGLLKCLKTRLENYDMKDNFPHEIGFFLGYPPEDVISFFKNKGKNYLLCGPWKVYHDVCSAQCIFEKHRKCTRIYCERYTSGTTLEKLAVRSSISC
ncbi:MAG: DUF3793 family protein [Clostridiales bacterium]|nr:DUF3793 family protein [Clostridiales bacterium]MDD7346944.1 DUF3793 family protein [Clostridiales bacterium]MDY4061207.1 DUF3793 family protein [Anaerovoracaceae bacterium]